MTLNYSSNSHFSLFKWAVVAGPGFRFQYLMTLSIGSIDHILSYKAINELNKQVLTCYYGISAYKMEMPGFLISLYFNSFPFKKEQELWMIQNTF